MSYARKKPYISADYEEMRSTRMDSEIYNPNSPQRVESEFKKPYLYDEHPKSEQTYTPPGGFIPVEPPPWTPPGSSQDCIPGGDAVGGGPNLCDPGQDCGQWVFTCAHMIKSFTAIGGSIQSIRYQSNDVVVVTACWGPDRGKLVVLATTLNDGEVETSFDKDECAGDEPECSPCDACDPVLYPPVISFTTQQMSTNGTQYLYASKGGGGPYTWTITATGTTPGTLSTTETASGAPVLYTAPSSNENCLNNPTITVTDFCGHTKTLKIAVNATNPAGAIFNQLILNGVYSNDVSCQSYGCSGDVRGTFACARCCTSTGGSRVLKYPYGACQTYFPDCTLEELLIECPNQFGSGSCGACSACDPDVLIDNRTDQQKTDGCCAALLL